MQPEERITWRGLNRDYSGTVIGTITIRDTTYYRVRLDNGKEMEVCTTSIKQNND